MPSTVPRAVWANWAGDQRCLPAAIERPASAAVAALQRAAAAGRHVRAAGSGHSFTGAALTDGTLVTLDRMDRLLDGDPATGVVRVQAGITLHALSERLAGLGLENLGDVDAQTLEGTIAPGETIKVHSEANPGRAFPVKVTEFSPGTRMTWNGGMPLGLFRGVRTFELSPAGDGATRFHMREEYTGPLLPPIWRSMPDLGPSFEQFARGLKARAERSGAPSA